MGNSNPWLCGRRAFLKGAGLTAAAGALPSAGASWAWRGFSEDEAHHIALLWPHVGEGNPQADSWRAGFELRIEAAGGCFAGLPVALATESIDAAGTPAGRMRQLLESGTEIVVAGIGSGVAGQVKGLFETHNATLITSGIGVNMLRAGEASPHVFHAGASQWQADWALGVHAARHIGSRGVLALSLRDSGYDAAYAFRRGFEQAGGQVLDQQTSFQPLHDHGQLTAMMRQAGAAGADFVYAGFTGPEARAFLDTFVAADLHGRIPLLGTGFMADEAGLAGLGAAAEGLLTAVTWTPGLPVQANTIFEAAFAARHGRPADVFAVMGYQAGQLLELAIIDSGESRGPGLRSALRRSRFDSPAGRFAMNELGLGETPVYLRQVKSGPGGLVNTPVQELAAAHAVDLRAEPIFATGRSGWTNAYLAV